MTEKLEEERAEQKLYDDVYKALCANHLNSDVADFLANLEVRFFRLERAQDVASRL